MCLSIPLFTIFEIIYLVFKSSTNFTRVPRAHIAMPSANLWRSLSTQYIRAHLAILKEIHSHSKHSRIDCYIYNLGFAVADLSVPQSV